MFQSTPPREGATVECRDGPAGEVSIRAPARGGDPARDGVPASFGFQSAPPREGATGLTRPGPARRPAFQSAPPREGATSWASAIECWPGGFNPRPRARGRCRRRRHDARRLDGFNPRPRARGRSLAVGDNGTWRTKFQSAPPREGAIAARRATRRQIHVSIRAPPRGGDPAPLCRRIRLASRFQSAPPREGAIPAGTYHGMHVRFQSAPPRGGRSGRGRASTWRRFGSFNPRPPARGRSRIVSASEATAKLAGSREPARNGQVVERRAVARSGQELETMALSVCGEPPGDRPDAPGSPPTFR